MEYFEVIKCDSQGQNIDHGTRLPGSKSTPLEPAPKVKIVTPGAGSQDQNINPGN